MPIGGVTNLADVFAGFQKAKQAVADNTVQVTKQTAERFIEVVVPGTPVLTGEHRGGWQVGLDAEPSGNTPLDPDGAETIANALAVIQEARPGQVIIIKNDKPVIEDLNNGRSDKAPEGFVEAGLDATTRRA